MGSFEERVAQVPESLKRDALWNFQVYPKALYFYDLAWEDDEIIAMPAPNIQRQKQYHRM